MLTDRPHARAGEVVRRDDAADEVGLAAALMREATRLDHPPAVAFAACLSWPPRPALRDRARALLVDQAVDRLRGDPAAQLRPGDVGVRTGGARSRGAQVDELALDRSSSGPLLEHDVAERGPIASTSSGAESRFTAWSSWRAGADRPSRSVEAAAISRSRPLPSGTIDGRARPPRDRRQAGRRTGPVRDRPGGAAERRHSGCSSATSARGSRCWCASRGAARAAT